MNTADLVRRLIEQERKSVKEVADLLHCGQHNVRRICRESGINFQRSVGGYTPVLTQKPISLLHAQIGRDIARFRVLKHEYSSGWMKELTGLSFAQQALSDVGAYNYTLTELIKISEVLGVSLAELTTLRTPE